jgi:enoyl-CoA hydratase/carnithine racemase
MSANNEASNPDHIICEANRGIVTVTLNRPHKLNALTKPMWQTLGDTFAALSADDDVRCIVLRGAGDRSFAPGNDISEFESERSNIDQARVYGAIMATTLGAIAECRHPTVALIQGICVGGGLEIAANCDLRICGQTSRFGVPINKLGLVMAHAELRGLLNLVGRAVTLEMLLEGRVFGADEAQAKGLVNRVVADADVETQALTMAQRIAAGAPLVARWHKQFIRRLDDPAPLTAAEVDEGYACFGSEDFEIGYRAFLAKQPPHFKGR